MMESGQQAEGVRGMERYRLVVEGELSPERAAWFGAREYHAAEGRTELLIEIVDQAELHGLLRSIRDINLRMIELTRMEQETGS
jgi:hypothetical protein